VLQYQTFNRSCAYAGLANLLLDYGITIEDRDIVTEALISYHLRYNTDDKRYIAGPFLQGKEWFDLYLNKVGYEFFERKLSKVDLVSTLADTTTKYMLAIKYGNAGKHAVVFLRKEANKFVFLNNKNSSSTESEHFFFSEDELKEKLEDKTLIGKIIPKRAIIEKDVQILFNETIKTIDKYRKTIEYEVVEKRTEEEQKVAKKNTLEVFFLDILSMMEIVKQDGLALKIKKLRTIYLEALKSHRQMSLSEYMDIKEFETIIDEYLGIVVNKRDNLRKI